MMNGEAVVVGVAIGSAAVLLTPLGRLLRVYAGAPHRPPFPKWACSLYGRPTVLFDAVAVVFFATMAWAGFSGSLPALGWFHLTCSALLAVAMLGKWTGVARRRSP